jgi:hypothetical protein
MSERFFNNAGPINPADHYCLPPLERFDLAEVERLIAQKRYFVLHAPRQTGKTTSLLALMHHLNAQSDYTCLYVNVEAAQGTREEVERAMRLIIGEIAENANFYLNDTVPQQIRDEIIAADAVEGGLSRLLSAWSRQNDKPLVVLLDEVDALIGDTLISLLRQLRAGYTQRPTAFPQTVILCGVRDVRDYRIHSNQSKEIITGGSAFNIKAESLRMGNFTQSEVERLYRQHQEETGQAFTSDAVQHVWALTQGQPWLVNALGYEVTSRVKANRDRRKVIELADINQAKETLIQRRDTHLDQLTDKLQEPRVQRVIAPILAGDSEPEQLPTDDVQYVLDLGLITLQGQLRIANPIYQEVIPRELVYTTSLTIAHETTWYLRHDGGLKMSKLLAAFQTFFREHSEHWIERFTYKEAGPQLLLQAFLQRIVNGGGRIEREYGLGRMRTDLLIIWPYANNTQTIVLELKILHRALEHTIEQGLAQTWEYCDRCGAEEAHLLIFDRSDKAWEDKVFQRQASYRDKLITIWGM